MFLAFYGEPRMHREPATDAPARDENSDVCSRCRMRGRRVVRLGVRIHELVRLAASC